MAIYPNQFQGYQTPGQYYYPQYNQQAGTPSQPVNSAPQPSNSIIWVQGEAGAKSYLVAPNTTVQLWDSESQTIYLKSADASGMPSIKTLDYTIRDGMPAEANNLPVEGFATVDEVNALRKQIDALSRKIRAISKEDKGNE